MFERNACCGVQFPILRGSATYGILFLCCLCNSINGIGSPRCAVAHELEPKESHAHRLALRFELPEHQAEIELRGRDARWQVVTTQVLDGQTIDVTRNVQFSIEPQIAEMDADGYLRPLANGSATMTATLGESHVTCRLDVSGMEVVQPVNFVNQVVPIFTKHGCNGGGCHGKAAGQAGFRLSLLGFEPQEDYEHLTIESRGRRLFPAMPEQSLLLQKAINAAPHGGGQRLEKDSHEYRMLARWIASGMPYGSDNDPRVMRIEIIPKAVRLAPEQQQQICVVAHYSDGTVEDITRAAQYESNNKDLAQVGEQGLVSLGQHPGDVAVMARYQGQVAVFRATIPLGVEVNEWPPTENAVDEAVFAKLQSLGIPPSTLCDDATFLRRVTLDICGRLPTIEEVEQYVASADSTKRAQLIDRLLDSDDYADFFARKWSVILRNRRERPGDQFGTFAFHQWLRENFKNNTRYHDFVRELLTASGTLENNPAIAWWREVSSTESRVEDTAQLFLGQRLQCARCHHHPFEKWSQTDYYQMAGFFSKVQRKEGPTPEEPMFVSGLGGAGAQHPKSGQWLPPAGLDTEPQSLSSTDDPRHQLVDWMTQEQNPFFAKSLVNRYWKHFLGTGLVEPEDDMRVTNPPNNPELLYALERHFIDSNYDLKSLIRLICNSSTYGLSSAANEFNIGDRKSFSRFYPKRLQAEVLLDAIDQVAMTQTRFDGLPGDIRAVMLPDTGFGSYFLDVFGRPGATTACECERSQEATLAQSLYLLNSKEIQSKLAEDSGLAASMHASSEPTKRLIQELYLSALSRKPADEELETAKAYVQARADQKRQAYEDLLWAILNSKEFLFNH